MSDEPQAILTENQAEPTRLQVGDRLQITIKESDEEVPTTYLSRVEDVTGEDIVIGWPTSRGIRAPARHDQILSMTFHNPTGVYGIDARVLKRMSRPFPTLTVRPQGTVFRVQRREHVRVQALVEVTLIAQYVTRTSDQESVDINRILTHTQNLSGGGLSIHFRAPLPVGSLYDVKLTLPDRGGPLSLIAKVVRCESMPTPTKPRQFDVGLAFIQITAAAQRRIVRYVFRAQQASLVKD